MRRNWHRITFIGFSATAVILLVVSFLLPPMGSIEPSVIQGVGELFAFAALSQIVPAIEAGKGVKIQRGETTLEVEGKEKEE